MLVMLDYILNQRLRENYKKALLLENADEMNEFLSGLSKTEQNDLFCFAVGYVIPRRKRVGTPINEYYLMHVLDGDDGQAYEDMNKVFNTVLLIVTVLFVFFLFHTA